MAKNSPGLVPISEMIAAAAFGPIPGMVASRSRWRAKGTIIASTWASSRAIISFSRAMWSRCSWHISA